MHTARLHISARGDACRYGEVNVQCTSSPTTGSTVSIEAIIEIGPTSYFVVMSVKVGTFTFFAAGDGYFLSTKTAVSTLTATGAHVDGDLLEQNVAKGGTAHTIHVSGDVVCGTTIGG